IQVGLEFECGISGSRLTAAQRQKIGIARALLRRPQVVILNEATAALDAGSQTKVLDRLLPEVEGKTLIMVMQSPRLAERMERTAVMRGGRVVETGTWAELSQSGTALSQLLGSE
ncbi:MAG: ABC transporter ATP-binding protein, partial [Planctomycetota bacterium]